MLKVPVLNLSVLQISVLQDRPDRGVQKIAAVSCSPVGYRLGGVKMGFWLTGKLGRAWVGA